MIRRPWLADAQFCAHAAEHWGADWRRVLMNKTYDSGATQRMALRWQGWLGGRSMQGKEKEQEP